MFKKMKKQIGCYKFDRNENDEIFNKMKEINLY